VTITQITEAGALAPAQLTGKTWKIKVIEGDRKGSSAYYPKEALQEGAPLFKENTKIFLNHPTQDDKFNQPERRVQDIAGYLTEGATYDGKDLYANATFLPQYQEMVKELAERGLIGMSIRAEGEVSEASGTKTLTRFTKVHSIDVVTEAGAGGGFVKLLESEKVSAPESGAESQKEKESLMEKEIVEALATLKTEMLEALTAALAEAKKPAVKDSKKEDDAEGPEDGKPDAEDKAEGEDGFGNPIKKKKPVVKESASFAEIDKALTEAKLPSASRTSVFALVEAGADLKETVDAEAAKVKSILEEADHSFKGYAHDEKSAKSLEEATAGIIDNLYGIKAVNGK
jgi:hypothetical protein